MRTFFRLCFLIHLAVASALASAQEVLPLPLYTVDLSKLISRELDINATGTLTFLTEHTLAVSICRNLRCNLATFDLGGETPRMIAKTNEFHASSALFRAPEGRVLAGNMQSEGKMGAVLFDSDLHVPILIPKAVDNRPQFLSTTGETFVKQNQHVWVAYKMGPPPERIREGIGAVLSVSNEAVAYLDQGTVHIEGMDGKPLGMFALKARPTIRFVGHDRLWVESGSEVEIADFNGKLIQTLEKPDGWGFRIGQSSDGSRILYDRYTRHISLAQKAEEDAVAVVTLGVGVGDEGANAEMVQVIDTRSGKKCFEWNSRKNLLVAGQFHADIDPSGRLIAIMNRTALNIYRSPETCIEK